MSLCIQTTKIYLSLGLSLLALAGVSTHAVHAEEVKARQGSEQPRLRIESPGGPIVAALHPEASPRAIAALRRAAANLEGAFSFTWVSPNGEVRTQSVPELAGVEAELNAVSLGLHEEVIADAGVAMEVMQHVLLPRHGRDKRTAPSPLFRSWIDRWRDERSAEFLIGVSKMELYEALGYSFSSGVVSRPVMRGSLALRVDTSGSDEAQGSNARVQPQLVFSLVDRPDQTGRWVVIGDVVEGLDLLRTISVRPLMRTTDKKGRLAEAVRLNGFEIEDGSQREDGNDIGNNDHSDHNDHNDHNDRDAVSASR